MRFILPFMWKTAEAVEPHIVVLSKVPRASRISEIESNFWAQVS